MTSFYDFTLAPFRHFLGPVYDAYRRVYEYTSSIVVPGHVVSTVEGVPLPDVVPDRGHKFYYSVYGPPDYPVSADIVGNDTEVKTQTGPEYWNRLMIDNSRRPKRQVEWLPGDVTKQEVFVEMPYTLNTTLPCSTVATRHS
jgi:hypothetical protein